MKHPLPHTFLLALLVVLGATVTQAATHSVEMSNFQFVPRDLSIAVGDMVTWVNKDLPGHDTVSGASGISVGIWDSNDQYSRLMLRNETYSFTFSNAGTFPYYCTPHWSSRDMNGSITATGGNTPPTVEIVSPANAAKFSTDSSFTIEAVASDSGGVASVEFFDGQISLGSDAIGPYSVVASNLSPGEHTLTARATDDEGAFTVSAAVVIEVSAAGVHVVEMIDFAFVPRDLVISSGDTVTWVNTALGQHDTVSGVSGVSSGIWDSTDQYGRLMRRNETYSFTFPDAGLFPYYCTPHWSSQDMSGSVTVNLSENAPPVVTLLSPGQNTVFGVSSAFTIEAAASDPDLGGSVVSVEFFDGNNSLGSVTSEPFLLVVSGFAAGEHLLTARATDDQGSATTSSAVSITILESGVHLVEVVDFAFVPRDISIAVGETVTWVNKGAADHDTVSGSGGVPGGVWDSTDAYGRLMRSNETFSFSFGSVGSFPYYCTPHWDSDDMNGSVVVANTPPSVALVSPAPDAIFPLNTSFTIEAVAGDSDIGGAIASVEFFDGANSLGVSVASPYTATAVNLAVGQHTLTAQATDNLGISTTSAAIDITVQDSGVFIVEMVDFAFEPRDLSVRVGDTVTWINRGVFAHDTVEGISGMPEGLWDSNAQYGRLMNRHETFSFQYQSAGNFPYYCTPHWASDDMVGSVKVDPPSSVITAVARVGGELSFNYSTVPGVVYHVEASPGVPAALWTRLKTTLATGDSLTFIDQDALEGRFYRVVSE